ncbi:hypothetical protein QOZ80_4BG0343200 [Eleusine coracana subsp. coracana]|nr:hypothetical protein QOZ80_4BG0343200 [Eleusine coracana subsp. coracana]
MAPPWVLLDRHVRFVHGGAAGTDQQRTTEEETFEEEEAMVANLEAMEPDLKVLDPPEINQLSMVKRTNQLRSGVIASTDKSLVVLYAGECYTNDPSTGCYLVYDASDGSLSVIPQLPDQFTFHALGARAAILSLS